MVLIIGFCAFACVGLVAMLVMRIIGAPRAVLRERVDVLSAQDASDGPSADPRLLRLQNYSSFPWLQRRLQGMASAERIADDLDRAAIPLRVGEFLALCVLVAVLLGFAAYQLLPTGLGQVIGSVAALALGLIFPRWFVSRRIRRRRAQFEALLPDALDILSRSIRAGNGLLVAIDSLVEQMPGVIAYEFGPMRQEVAAGLSLEEALRELDRRMESRDLHIVITALLIQREVGGNLTEILDNVSTTMRQRATLRREVKVLTSQQRYGAWVITFVPPMILLMLSITNWEFIRPMLSTTFGLTAIAIAVVLEIAGILGLKLVTSFEV